MRMRRRMIFLALMLAAVQVHAGWIIKMSSTAPDGTKQVEIFTIQDNKWKVESEGTGTVLFDLEKDELIIVDHESRTAYVGSPSEMASMRDNAMAQMEEQLKNMPAEQREMVRKMMAQQMQSQPSAAKSIDVQVRKTGEKATVAGYAVEKYEVRVGGAHREDVWLTSRILLKDELDMDKLQTFMEGMAWGGSEETLYSSSPEYIQLYRQGFPLKQATIMPGGNIVSEAVQVEKKNVPNSAFSVPNGYERKGLSDMAKARMKP